MKRKRCEECKKNYEVSELALCDTCVIKSYEKTYDNAVKDIIAWLRYNGLCTTCGFVLKDAHYCRNCKERIAVECDTDGLIKSLRKEFLK